MQHRGQDGAGLVTSDGESLKLHKDIGLVNDVFEQAEFADLSGHAAIGHIRNATHDDGNIENVQPLVFRSQTGGMALAHNGNIMNAYTLRGELEGEGSIFQTTSDTEVLAHLIRRNGKMTTKDASSDALGQEVDRKSTRLNSSHVAIS